MRRYKTDCCICGKETRARRTTAKNMDVCYSCHIESERKHKKSGEFP